MQIRIEWDGRDDWSDDTKAMLLRDFDLESPEWLWVGDRGIGWVLYGETDDVGEAVQWLKDEGFEGFRVWVLRY